MVFEAISDHGLVVTEVATLLKELPDHLRDAAVFALATGLRAANVMGLT